MKISMSVRGLLLVGALAWAVLPGCQTKADHDHEHAEEGHDHDKAEKKAGHDHAGNDHADHAGHDHAKKDAPTTAAVAPGAVPAAPKGGCDCQKDVASECQKGKAAGHDHADHAGHDHAKAAAAHVDDGCTHGKKDRESAADQKVGNPTGPLDEKLGKALAGVKKIDVLALMKDPAGFDGKTVHLEGEVTDMCFHSRGWFGIVSPDGKKVVRVITNKAGFKVPSNAVGAEAKLEGAVKLITLKPEQIKHYQRMHKFISAEDVRSGKPVVQPIIIATGAEFKR
jgi:hypothetical protein